jgi:superoxide reductase
MAEFRRIYLCELCGNVVEVLLAGQGELVCCGQPMKLMPEQTADSATEKHVPLIEREDGGYKVKVGSVPHPMLEKHYIAWIELEADGSTCRKFLSPGTEPAAFFPCPEAKLLRAREYCNIHGLWKG